METLVVTLLVAAEAGRLEPAPSRTRRRDRSSARSPSAAAASCCRQVRLCRSSRRPTPSAPDAIEGGIERAEEAQAEARRRSSSTRRSWPRRAPRPPGSARTPGPRRSGSSPRCASRRRPRPTRIAERGRGADRAPSGSRSCASCAARSAGCRPTWPSRIVGESLARRGPPARHRRRFLADLEAGDDPPDRRAPARWCRHGRRGASGARARGRSPRGRSPQRQRRSPASSAVGAPDWSTGWPTTCFSVAGCSTASAALRRALADPAVGRRRPRRACVRAAARRQARARPALDVVAAAGPRSAGRAARDLSDALERLGRRAACSAAAERGRRARRGRGRAVPVRPHRRRPTRSCASALDDPSRARDAAGRLLGRPARRARSPPRPCAWLAQAVRAARGPQLRHACDELRRAGRGPRREQLVAS